MIKRKRISKKLTQYELAKLLQVNRSYISKLENKVFTDPSFRIIKRLSKILDIDFNTLINWFYEI